MRILIVGACRLGRVLAGELLHAGHDVRLLDESGERLAALPGAFGGKAIQGSPLDQPTLRDAVAGCDAIGTVTADDNVNAVVALAARREFRLPLAVAVIANPRRAEALEGLGARIVCPTVQAAREMHLALVRSGVESELSLGDNGGIYRVDVPVRLVRRSLAELERPGELIPVAVEREGRLLMAMPGLELARGDVLHVAAISRDHVTDLVRP